MPPVPPWPPANREAPRASGPPEAPSPQRHHVAAHGQTPRVRGFAKQGPGPLEAKGDLRSLPGQHLYPLATLPSCCHSQPSWDPEAENEDVRTLRNYKDECRGPVLEFTEKD